MQQDPGTTLLDLLAFCTGTLLDGIESEEKPHATNALADALDLDMTQYWTPTRATYFDHVSKARIAEVVSAAVSPKVAADLGKMKKADAAAAAELRLAKAAWLPEILTDREIPTTPFWDVHDDHNEDDADTGDGTGETSDSENDEEEPDAGNSTGHVNDMPPDTARASGSGKALAPRPFPTAGSMNSAQPGPLAK
jgi:ParB family chromosome partitioning protein